MVVAIVGTKTVPAELVFAFSAAHMVAASILRYHDSTFGTGFFQEQVPKVGDVLRVEGEQSSYFTHHFFTKREVGWVSPRVLAHGALDVVRALLQTDVTTVVAVIARALSDVFSLHQVVFHGYVTDLLQRVNVCSRVILICLLNEHLGNLRDFINSFANAVGTFDSHLF